MSALLSWHGLLGASLGPPARLAVDGVGASLTAGPWLSAWNGAYPIPPCTWGVTINATDGTPATRSMVVASLDSAGGPGALYLGQNTTGVIFAFMANSVNGGAVATGGLIQSGVETQIIVTYSSANGVMIYQDGVDVTASQTIQTSVGDSKSPSNVISLADGDRGSSIPFAGYVRQGHFGWGEATAPQVAALSAALAANAQGAVLALKRDVGALVTYIPVLRTDDAQAPTGRYVNLAGGVQGGAVGTVAADLEPLP